MRKILRVVKNDIITIKRIMNIINFNIKNNTDQNETINSRRNANNIKIKETEKCRI
jgi:hypothetical protein